MIARQLMDGDLLGASRLAIVRDDFEQHQVGGCRGLGYQAGSKCSHVGRHDCAVCC